MGKVVCIQRTSSKMKEKSRFVNSLWLSKHSHKISQSFLNFHNHKKNIIQSVCSNAFLVKLKYSERIMGFTFFLSSCLGTCLTLNLLVFMFDIFNIQCPSSMSILTLNFDSFHISWAPNYALCFPLLFRSYQ